MPVERRINYNKSVFTYKALNNMTPDYIIKLLTPTVVTSTFSFKREE